MAGKKVSGPPEWQNDVAKLLGVDTAKPGADVTAIQAVDVTQIKDPQPSSAQPAEEGPALFCPNPCAEVLLKDGGTKTIVSVDGKVIGEVQTFTPDLVTQAVKQGEHLFYVIPEAGKPVIGPMTKEEADQLVKKLDEAVGVAEMSVPTVVSQDSTDWGPTAQEINDAFIKKVQESPVNFTTEELPGVGLGNLNAISKLELGGGFPIGKLTQVYGHHHSGKSWLMQNAMAQNMADKILGQYAECDVKITQQVHDSFIVEPKTPEEKEVPMPASCSICGGTFGACKCLIIVDPAYTLKTGHGPKMSWDAASQLLNQFKELAKSVNKPVITSQQAIAQKSVNLERFELHKGLFVEGTVVAYCTTTSDIPTLTIPVDPADPDWEGTARKQFYTHFAHLWLKHAATTGRLGVRFDLEQTNNGSYYSVITLFRYYGTNLAEPNSKGFGCFDLEEEFKKYLAPKAHFIKGPNFKITVDEADPKSMVSMLKQELLGTPPVHKETGPLTVTLTEDQIASAKTNLKIVNDAIWAYNDDVVAGAKEDSVALTSLKSAKVGWEAHIASLEVKLNNLKLAQAKQLNLGEAPGGKFFPYEPSYVMTPADKEAFGPLKPMESIPKLKAESEAFAQTIALDTLAQKIKEPLDSYFLGFPMKITDLPGFEEALHGTGDETFTKHTVFTLRVEAISKLKGGMNGFDLSSWITERTPPCCHYATFDECKDSHALNQYFDKLGHEHFELKHGNAAVNHLSLVNAAKALIVAFQHAKNPKLGAAWSANQFNAQLPAKAPKVTEFDLSAETPLVAYAIALEYFFVQQNEEEFQEPEGVEVYELTLSNLTQEEVDDIMKTVTKSKSKNEVLVHKGTRKEVGTKSKAIVVFPFESSSMQVNGEPIMYKTQLNEDGTISCNCAGWTMGSAKNSAGRFCKHTKAIQVEAELAYKKWKKGIPLGGDFDIVPASVAQATSKTLYSALKEKVVPGQETMFKAKRIVEI